MRCAFIILLITTCASGQLALKGHKLGETPTEFVAADAPFAKRLAECTSLAPKLLSYEQVHAMDSQSILELRLSYPNSYSKKDLEKLARANQLFSRDERYPAQRTFCDAAEAAIYKGSQQVFGSDVNMPDIEIDSAFYRFTAGKLDEIFLYLHNAEASSVRADLTKRIGSEPRVASATFQNTYGAVFANTRSTWTMSGETCLLSDSGNPSETTITVMLLSDEALRSLETANRSRKSPLD